MTLKPKVYIRTDGSPEIGLGHLTRCIALAYMLKKDFAITFVCKEIPEKISREFFYAHQNAIAKIKSLF